MNHDVFISYSSQNRDAAQAICHVLEQNEIRCWIAPRDIPGGSQYGDIIEDAIKVSKVIVVLFSETAASSPWVSGELNVAFEEQKTIIPFRLDQTPLKGQNRVMLNQRHWIDAYPDYKTKFTDLVLAVSQATGRDVKPAPAVAPAGPATTARPAAPASPVGGQGAPRQSGSGPVELTYGSSAAAQAAGRRAAQPGVAGPRPLGANGRPLASATPRRQAAAPTMPPANAPRPAIQGHQRPPVPAYQPASKPTAQPSQPKGGIAKWKIIVPIAAAVVLLVVLLLVFSGPSAEERRAQNEYQQKVESCRNIIASADTFEDLEEASDLLDDIEILEQRYRSSMPDVFNQFQTLSSEYEDMQQQRRREAIQLAERFKNGGDFRSAFEHYLAASKALPDDEELKRLMNEVLVEMGHIYVKDVEYSNSEEDGTDIDEAGSTLYASRMHYLFPKVVYDSYLPEGSEVTRLHFSYKIFNPDGTMKSGTNSPAGYTSNGSFLVAVGERDQGEWLSGWGNSTTSTYEAGTYTFELYFKDHKIYEETFELL